MDYRKEAIFMDIGKHHFRLGMRTLKTSLAVVLCLLFNHFTNFGSPMVTSVSAVFAMRENITSAFTFGKSRILGNALGGGAALIFFLVAQHIQRTFLLQLIAVPLFIIFIIVLSDAFGNNAGIVGAIATFLIIALSTSGQKLDTVQFALERVIDTFVGTFIAIGVNAFIKPPDTEHKEEVVSDELETLYAQVATLQERIKTLEALDAELKAEEIAEEDHNKK